MFHIRIHTSNIPRLIQDTTAVHSHLYHKIVIDHKTIAAWVCRHFQHHLQLLHETTTCQFRMWHYEAAKSIFVHIHKKTLWPNRSTSTPHCRAAAFNLFLPLARFDRAALPNTSICIIASDWCSLMYHYSLCRHTTHARFAYGTFSPRGKSNK